MMVAISKAVGWIGRALDRRQSKEEMGHTRLVCISRLLLARLAVEQRMDFPGAIVCLGQCVEVLAIAGGDKGGDWVTKHVVEPEIRETTRRLCIGGYSESSRRG